MHASSSQGSCSRASRGGCQASCARAGAMRQSSLWTLLRSSSPLSRELNLSPFLCVWCVCDANGMRGWLDGI